MLFDFWLRAWPSGWDLALPLLQLIVPSARKSSQKTPQIVEGEKLIKLPWLVHGFSTRVGGASKAYGKDTLNLGFTKEDTRAVVEKNRAAFQKAIGATDKKAKAWP